MSGSLEIPTPRWALPLLAPARYKGARGGRASGKSHFFADCTVEEMAADPNLRFVCIREIQRSLKYSAKSLIEAKIKTHGVEHLFDVRNNEIRRLGGDGVVIFEGMQEHTKESLKSLEGFGRAWVEEAHTITQGSFDLLLPTIRAPGSEIWFSWNPMRPVDPVDEFFCKNPPDNAVLVHVNYLDNPFCPPEVTEQAQMWQTRDAEGYEHVWLGGYFIGGSGRVYSTFRNLEYPEGNIATDLHDPGGELLVGMDFNVDPMSLVIATRAVDECHIHDAWEIPTSNTEEAAQELRRQYPNRRIVVCPDPSGKARKTSAPVGQTDHTILQKYGFEVRAPRAAPAVVDRENNAKSMYLDLETGRRRCLIHPRAQKLVEALSMLRYKEETSVRDKKSGYDHICDAADYLLWQEFNVLKQRNVPRTRTVRI